MEANLKSLTRKNGKTYTVRANRDRIFFPDEWMKFYDNLKTKQKHTFECLISTGARINEMRNVRVSDCDLERNRIVLRVTKVKAAKKEKNPRPRIIPISTKFTKYLKKHIRTHNLQNDSYIGILSTPAANTGMKKALKKSEIKDWYMFSVHNVRKTFETWLMALDIDGLKITAHLGHSMAIAASNYISPDVFTWNEKDKMRNILGRDLYGR